MAEDRYKYFRIEAREISDALARGALEIERGAGQEVVTRLMRHAHTLKGAARVVGATMVSDLAHRLEDALGSHRDRTEPPSTDEVDLLLTLIDAIQGSIVELGMEHEPRNAHERLSGRASLSGGERPAAVAVDEFQTVRVDLREMDELLEGVAESAVQVAALRNATGEMSTLLRTANGLVDRMDRALLIGHGERELLSQIRPVAAELSNLLDGLKSKLASTGDRAAREIEQVRTRSERLRLVPVGTIFDVLERTARDAASELGKVVEFRPYGGEIRLDQPVLAALRDGLSHVVRNAVAHGIETPEERVSRGKPRAGTIELIVERRRGRARIRCGDDGRGIELEAVRRAAIARRLIDADRAATMEIDQAVALLKRGGLSTATEVSQISGRGVGLQVMQDVADRFKGQLELETIPGQGLLVEITVPILLSSLSALVATAGDTIVAFPRDAVASTIRLKQSEIVRGAQGESILWQGRAIPFAPLAALLEDTESKRTADQAWNVVLLQSDRDEAAVGVERIHGIQTLVVRTLPRAVGTLPLLAGASLDADGNPWLVVEPAAVIAAVRSSQRVTSLLEKPPRPRVLVIDDSLTTRMLERTILENAGFEVDVATSGEEGLEKGALKQYDVFIVDVEMPGIDGFEFVRRTREDPALRKTPAILVTSLNSPDHKRKGMEVGARGYIVKGEFDELALLGSIRRLIG